MYQKSTPILKIPYISKGEGIEEESERLQSQIIENQLFAGIMGIPKVVFEEGDYDLYDNLNDTYTLIIKNKSGPSLLGICNYCLFMEDDVVVFDKLKKGEFYYVYLAYQEMMRIEPNRFRKVLSPTPKKSDKYILLATVNLRGSQAVLNENPDGKLYAKNIISHITDGTNPHTKDLFQDRLTINDWLKINDSYIYETKYVDGYFSGNGNYTLITMEKEVAFVNVMPKTNGYGQFWINIDKKDVYVYNNGDGGGDFVLEVRLKEF